MDLSSSGGRRRGAPGSPPGSPKRGGEFQQERIGNMVRSQSREVLLGPSQRSSLHKSLDPSARSFGRAAVLIAAVFVGVCLAIVACSETRFTDLPSVFSDVVWMRRTPWTAQDNVASAVAVMLGLVPLIFFDELICGIVRLDSGARWYAVHSLGNFIVAAISVPDFFFAARRPPALISVEYCRTLHATHWSACSDWPTALIISMHAYHMIRFRLSKDDLFHHLLFVPLIGGLNFVYPWGVGGNILCFFISGLPGGIDYAMLSAVKAGRMSSYAEKRINCSINTWIRSPGIVMFVTLVGACWVHPLEGTPPSDLMPWYFFVPVCGVIFFNAQYYAQRVIGNYYIKKAQLYGSQGLLKVDLHAS